MLTQLLAQYASTLPQIAKMVEDVDDATAVRQYAGLVNHPAWTLGHLCTASGFALVLLGESSDAVSPEMQKLYGPGSIPAADASIYMPKAQSLARLTALHALVAQAVAAKHETHFPLPSPERLRSFAPTIGQIVFYLLAAHESYHLGQLAQWRRAAGLPRA